MSVRFEVFGWRSNRMVGEQIIECSEEPFRCKNPNHAPCYLSDYGRGGETLNDGVVINQGKTCRKQCRVCHAVYEFPYKEPPIPASERGIHRVP